MHETSSRLAVKTGGKLKAASFYCLRRDKTVPTRLTRSSPVMADDLTFRGVGQDHV